MEERARSRLVEDERPGETVPGAEEEENEDGDEDNDDDEEFAATERR